MKNTSIFFSKFFFYEGTCDNSFFFLVGVGVNQYHHMLKLILLQDGLKPIQVAAAGGNRVVVEILLPLTSALASVPEWSIDGILQHMQREARGIEVPSTYSSILLRIDIT